MTATSISSLAYLTADVPGVGGVLKERPEDFRVEELPLYQPCGAGEHLYLFIEKQRHTTSEAMHRLAKIFHVPRGEIGYAGLKDKYAVTRQQFSIRLPDASRDAEGLARIAHTPMKLLWSARHGNKLRRGHLAGNRFDIRVRQVAPDAEARARTVLERLAWQGVPNFVGEQRFGYRGNNDRVGRHLLLGQWQEALDIMLGEPCHLDSPDLQVARQAYAQRDYARALELWPRRLHFDRQALDVLRQGRPPQVAALTIDGQQRELLLSSLQSGIFNRVLDRRLRDPAMGIHQLVEGDLAFKHDSGAVFMVDGPTALAENAPDGRAPRLLVSPSGPMWGARMPAPAGLPAQWECEALAAYDLTARHFEDGPLGLVAGGRRPLRAILMNPDLGSGVDEHGPFLRVAFDLTKGSFATIVLREIMKPEQTGATLPDDAGD